jgi:death-on-curing protein
MMAALAYSLALNHAFHDGNKRIAQAAMEAMLIFNGHGIIAPVGEQETVFLDLAAGLTSRDDFTAWVASRAVSIP